MFWYAVELSAIMQFFSIALFRDSKLYNGEHGETIQLVLGLASIVYWILGIGLFAACFFKSDFTWYDPFLVVVLGFVASLLIRYITAIVARVFVLRALVDILGVAGVIFSVVLVYRFVF